MDYGHKHATSYRILMSVADEGSSFEEYPLKQLEYLRDFFESRNRPIPEGLRGAISLLKFEEIKNK